MMEDIKTGKLRIPILIVYYKAMIYLILAILSSTAISVLMRVFDKYIKNNMIMFFANYSACTVLSALFLFVDKEKLFGTGTTGNGVGFAVFLGGISGIMYLVSFMLLQFNISKNGVVLAATFMKLGVLVPVLMSVLLGWDRPTGLQVSGVVLAILAIVLINGEGDREQKKGNGGLWLVLLLLLGGFTDSLSNIYDKLGNPELKNGYLLFIFIVAMLFSIAVAFKRKQRFNGKDFLFGVLIGIPNYFSARFLLFSLAKIPAIVAYPVYNIGVILLIGLIGMAAFKESLSKRKTFGMAVIILSIVFLNMKL